MLHRAGVNVALLWGKGQVGELVEGLVPVGVVLTDCGLVRHVHVVFGPAHTDRWREEPCGVADECIS